MTCNEPTTQPEKEPHCGGASSKPCCEHCTPEKVRAVKRVVPILMGIATIAMIALMGRGRGAARGGGPGAGDCSTVRHKH